MKRQQAARRSFDEFVAWKTEQATSAPIGRLITLEDHSSEFPVERVGSPWTRSHYDGDFSVFLPPASTPAVSLVFVQSREGNTGTRRPQELGGGPTDLHFIYEGLSRVAADAVLAGARTASGPNTFFSVWHPEMVALRRGLGLSRHPAQVVISNEGSADLDTTLLFNVPEVPVFLLAGAGCQERCAAGLARRPWITMIGMNHGGLALALSQLRSTHAIHRISAIGGRRAASGLIDAGLVQDLCLTTTARSGGERDTPFYVGRATPAWRVIGKKISREEPLIHFDHLALSGR